MFKKIVLSVWFGLVFAGKIFAQNVDYYLPYPGILPDHPLYWVKMIRDRLVLLTTTSRPAKADKLLLYADKRLGAAWALLDGGKQALGVSTLTKAEKYLEQAAAAAGDAAFKERLGKAVLKHEEVIRRLQPKVEEAYQPVFNGLLARLAVLKPPAATAPETVEITAPKEANVYELLLAEAEKNGWEVKVKDYDFGKLVEAVGGTANTADKSWFFYVNGVVGDKASDQFEVKAGDKVEWRYETIKP
jgi:hypothetical protein